MSDMKMSDFFVLPTLASPRLGFNVEIVRMEGCPTFRYKEARHIQMKSPEEALAVSIAINEHDSMVEEIAELKEFAEMIASGANEDPQAALVHLRTHSREAKKLLEKLQKGEE